MRKINGFMRSFLLTAMVSVGSLGSISHEVSAQGIRLDPEEVQKLTQLAKDNGAPIYFGRGEILYLIPDNSVGQGHIHGINIDLSEERTDPAVLTIWVEDPVIFPELPNISSEGHAGIEQFQAEVSKEGGRYLGERGSWTFSFSKDGALRRFKHSVVMSGLDARTGSEYRMESAHDWFRWYLEERVPLKFPGVSSKWNSVTQFWFEQLSRGASDGAKTKIPPPIVLGDVMEGRRYAANGKLKPDEIDVDNGRPLIETPYGSSYKQRYSYDLSKEKSKRFEAIDDIEEWFQHDVPPREMTAGEKKAFVESLEGALLYYPIDNAIVTERDIEDVKSYAVLYKRMRMDMGPIDNDILGVFKRLDQKFGMEHAPPFFFDPEGKHK